jgi:hypothetical protein
MECCVPTMLTMRAGKCSSSENPKAIFLHNYYLNDLNIGKQTYHSFGTKLRQGTKYWNPCQYNPVYQREQLYTSVLPPENAFDDYKKNTYSIFKIYRFFRSTQFMETHAKIGKEIESFLCPVGWNFIYITLVLFLRWWLSFHSRLAAKTIEVCSNR